ncbi:hypothetical protein DFP72DRAFT_1042730 [Ephemerocybe angulata]|uniref:Uncharacterized protein n=1 Tax=Ephemerocybe angulata TaxID=980116 RepID=A0A8H6I7R1_9AGAR|nr:hypothetical protein DFP72DRAFT_1042730 [Tulosesus angulatus]
MHAIHTLAHRAPPASRTRARWQPYNSLPTYTASTSSSGSKSGSPAPSYTPPTTVISPCEPAPVCDSKSERSAPHCPPVSSPDALRDANTCKNKFALGLVDQAVKTLCEVWRPQDIPPAFSNPRTTKLAASLPNLSSATILDHASLHRHAPKVPTTSITASTSFPTTYTSPPASSAPALVQPGTSSQLRNLVPVRGFVHEILRRSRTSGCVLQTALCYLEAIRPKIPELAHLERIGKGTNGEPESGPRIFQATEEEIEQSRREEALELSVSECEPTVRFSEDENEVEAETMDTVRVEVDEDQFMQPPDAPSMNQQQSASLSSISTGPSSLHIEETEFTSTNTSTASPPPIPIPIADLPSPLLCPRRAFLAALILASKFTQDKCYSNRAWAKLSGLPPREIGRCERALGSALEWRLWVGKTSSTSEQASPLQSHRPMVRSQSEPSLIMPVASPIECITHTPASASSAPLPENAAANVVLGDSPRVPRERRTIKRASTLPSGAMSDALALASNNATQSGPFPDVPSEYAQSDLGAITSSTLVHAQASLFPSVQLHAPSPTLSTSASTLSNSPSPDMPGLTYSPSSVSSSPSSACSSTTDRVLQMSSAFFDDASQSGEFFNSPVACINTKLLVPGFAGAAANVGHLGFHGYRKLSPSVLLHQYSVPPIPAYGGSGTSPQVVADPISDYHPSHGSYLFANGFAPSYHQHGF